MDLPFGQLTRDILNSDNVYLVDSGGELFVWMGKRSARFLRYAGFKLAEELTEMMPRGCFGGAEETLIDEIVADNSLEQTLTAHKRLPPQPCPEGAESEVSTRSLKPKFERILCSSVPHITILEHIIIFFHFF